MTLYDKLTKINSTRFHMPGSKGKTLYPFDVFGVDFTETFETGNLYLGDEPILSSQKYVAEFYNAKECYFCTDGSSGGLRACLLALCDRGDTIIVDRNSHKSLISSIIMLGLNVIFTGINLKDNIPSVLAINDIQKLINKDVKLLVITSPNYYGINQDIKSVAKLCEKYNIKLLIDAAHSAHFPSIGLRSAIDDGANLACVSVHKTLPALGQASVILSDGSVDNIREKIEMFGTTSPSYPIMSSIELAIKFALENPEKMSILINKIIEFKKLVADKTKFKVLDNDDITRIVILGCDISSELYYKYNIAVEMGFNYGVVLICTIADSEIDFEKLLLALIELSYLVYKPKPVKIPISYSQISIRDAYFSDYITLEIENAQGYVAYENITPYPPGVPVLYPGEIITKEHIEFIKNICYNKKIKVIKE